MKKFFVFILPATLLLCCCKNNSATLTTANQVQQPWETTIDDNRITMVKNDGFLQITVVVPQQNLNDFEDFDAYTALLTEAFADYLKITDRGKFQCPGLETVSEKPEKDCRITNFRIPEQALKTVAK